jgi:hypothetical protein
MRPSVQVEGLNELRREIRRIADADLKTELVEANKQLAAEVIRRAMPNVPVLTGRLAGSVRGLGNFSGAVGKAGGARVPYAATIHWGRIQRGAVRGRPFLRDAAAALEADIEDRYLSHIDRLLDRVRAR